MPPKARRCGHCANCLKGPAAKVGCLTLRQERLSSGKQPIKRSAPGQGGASRRSKSPAASGDSGGWQSDWEQPGSPSPFSPRAGGSSSDEEEDDAEAGGSRQQPRAGRGQSTGSRSKAALEAIAWREIVRGKPEYVRRVAGGPERLSCGAACCLVGCPRAPRRPLLLPASLSDRRRGAST